MIGTGAAQGIHDAGGTLAQADLKHVLLVRPGAEQKVLDLESAYLLRDPKLDVPLQAGDLLYIPMMSSPKLP